jgi:hypothetical protein
MAVTDWKRLSLLPLLTIVSCFAMLSAPKIGYSQELPLPTVYKIKYRSVDRVYLEGGKADGLMPGDRVGMFLGDSLAVILEVAYASDHSASCKIISGQGELKSGQMLAVISRVERVASLPALTDTARSDTAHTAVVELSRPVTANKRTGKGSHVYGLAAFQWMTQHDQMGGGLDFSQLTMRLNLRASNLWSQPVTLVIRSRGQHDDRARSYSSGLSNSEWDNRIYEFSLSYGGGDNATSFQVGRILPHHLTRVGYVDGAAVDRHLGAGWHLGLSGGAKPRWQYSSNEVSLQKYGGYIGYENRARKDIQFEQYAVVAGEYHGGEISRELVDLEGSLNLGSSLWFNNQFEIDINRGWRKEKSGRSFDLSSVYLSARWRLSKRVSLGSSYDTRRNYWTYTQQSIADSLFDDQLRRGARADFNLNLPHQFNLNSQIGYRKAADEPDPTVSLVLYASKAGIPTTQTRASVRYSKFNGPSIDGYNYSIRLAQRFGDKLSLEAADGLYRYDLTSNNDSRSNHWWEGVLRLEAIRGWYTDLLYQYNSGDDTRGYTFRAEIGKRF